MKSYLEYKDEKSSKFWEVILKNTTLTIRYGKIGAKGKTLVKTFESAEKAQKEYDKLIKAKTKKGYVEVSEAELELQTIDLEEAKSLIKKHAGDFEKHCLNLLGGWWHVEETIYHSPKSVKKDSYEIPHVALIHGDLDVDLLESKYNSFLMVFGNLKVNRAIIDCEIIVTGNVIIDEIGVFESMGDNTLHVGGNILAKNLLSLDHHFKVNGDFEITGEDFERGCDVADYSFHKDCYNSDEEDEDEWWPDSDAIANRVRKNLPIFGFE